MSESPVITEKAGKSQGSHPWLFYSVLTIVLWGGYGATSKAVADDINAYMNQVLFTIGMFPLILLVFRSPRMSGGRKRGLGIFFAFLTGILGGLGNIMFFSSLNWGGRASVVVPMTGLSPLVTVVAAYAVLHERMSTYQKIGLGVALPAIYLLSL